jgi:hypothetical protein
MHDQTNHQTDPQKRLPNNVAIDVPAERGRRNDQRPKADKQRDFPGGHSSASNHCHNVPYRSIRVWGKPKTSLDQARDAAFSRLTAFSLAVQRSG